MTSNSPRNCFVAPTRKFFKEKLFTAIHFFDGPLVVDYRSKNETDCGCSSTAIERPGESPGGAGSRPAIRFLTHDIFCPSSFSDGPLSQDYRQKAGNRQRVQIPPSPPDGEVSCSPFVRRDLCGRVKFYGATGSNYGQFQGWPQSSRVATRQEERCKNRLHRHPI